MKGLYDVDDESTCVDLRILYMYHIVDVFPQDYYLGRLVSFNSAESYK